MIRPVMTTLCMRTHLGVLGSTRRGDGLSRALSSYLLDLHLRRDLRSAHSLGTLPLTLSSPVSRLSLTSFPWALGALLCLVSVSPFPRRAERASSSPGASWPVDPELD